MNYKVYDSIAALKAMKPRWDKLYEGSKTSNFFLSHNWVTATATTYFGDQNIYVASVEQADTIYAVAPFIRIGGRIKFLANNEMADYSDILVDPSVPEAIDILLENLFAEQGLNSYTLNCIPSSSLAYEAIPEFAKKAGLYVYSQVVCPNPFVRIEKDFSILFPEITSKKLRQELRTTQNHLGRLGEWEFAVAHSAQERAMSFDYLQDFHRTRQRNKAGHSIFDDKQHCDFLSKLVQQPYDVQSKGPQLHLSAITLNSRPISVAMSLTVQDDLYYWVPSFDQTIPNVSLGKLHIRYLLEDCCTLQRRRFDFMGGDERYKYQWTNQEYFVADTLIFRQKHRHTWLRFKKYTRAKLKEYTIKYKYLGVLWQRISKIIS